jgi:hypothetical protein
MAKKMAIAFARTSSGAAWEGHMQSREAEDPRLGQGGPRDISLVNSHRGLFIAYLIGGAVMLLGGIAELVFGVAAEQRSLEDIATPLSAVSYPDKRITGGARTGFARGLVTDPSDPRTAEQTGERPPGQ